MAFDAGHKAGAEDAGSGELLAEAQALQYAFYDPAGKTRRTIALDEPAMAVGLETIEHEEGCRCGLYVALKAVERQRWLSRPLLGNLPSPRLAKACNNQPTDTSLHRLGDAQITSVVPGASAGGK